ncbi:recombinase family protein [Flavobacterium sp. W22_SRS_FP1]|uniref:recombinase family protein n=1 Tax=Flavobacterium sp. W22_SRS_FP1 TaxID=3240276 RepID=UPI003F8DE2C9
MKKTAFIYCRVSTDKQETERQIRELTNYCIQNDFEIVGTLEEEISATKSIKSREHLIQLVKDSKANHFISQDISRFSRNTKVGIELKDRLHQLKVCLIFIQTGLKSLNEDGTENDTARLLFNMLLSVYEMENSTKIKMIKNGLANAKANGKILGRRVGYKENLILKYPRIVKELKTNSIRRTALLCSVQKSLVQRVKLQMDSV